ncbi:MAG: hypothetical protein ACK4SY_07070 [Pyrobaculum sp.]
MSLYRWQSRAYSSWADALFVTCLSGVLGEKVDTVEEFFAICRERVLKECVEDDSHPICRDSDKLYASGGQDFCVQLISGCQAAAMV